MTLYAHTPNGDGEWHTLEDHLVAVATKAAEFADFFGKGELAKLLGLLHDMGKLNPEFQAYLEACYRAEIEGTNAERRGPPHSIWGAYFAYLLIRGHMRNARWPILALPIQGHHGQLPDKGTVGEQSLMEFGETHPNAFQSMKSLWHQLNQREDMQAPTIELPEIPKLEQDLLTRMLFSALIDADRLDTEKHDNTNKAACRNLAAPSLAELRQALSEHLLTLPEASPPLERVRREVHQSCIEAASMTPGIFRLTVPTGGGKTLSGMAFALNHALQHDLRQVVIALPYTSIIEQNAKVYREIPGFGPAAVLEHHSAVEPRSNELDPQDRQSLRAQFATENWDIPIVVTTTVQLFESLFSNRTSKVRKLHHLAKSVIILDEIQALPPTLLLPTFDILRTLSKSISEGGYGATVVLCTATQPSLDSERLASLLNEAQIREIVSDYPRHFNLLKRVDYEWKPEPVSWSALAADLDSFSQVLVVLNTKRDALELIDALDDQSESLFHLSTLLCMAHRRKVLEEVRSRLDSSQPVKLISTQVIECGVELDFPVVYRATGPLDRIVQVAGRCNRNGGLDRGRVVIFNPSEGTAPRGPYKVGIGLAEFLLREHETEELHDPALYEEYFRRLYNDLGNDLDKHRVQESREALNFPEVANRYRLIRNDTIPVVVQYGAHWEQRLNAFLESPGRDTWQQLQPFVVNLYEHELRKNQPWAEEVSENLYLWPANWYDQRKGIINPPSGSPLSDPSDLIV